MTNEWDEYKKKTPSKIKSTPWYDEDKNGIKLEKVENLRDAYFLLLRSMNPLKKVSSDAIGRALRMIYLTRDSEKLSFLTGKPVTSTSTAASTTSNSNTDVKNIFVIPVVRSDSNTNNMKDSNPDIPKEDNFRIVCGKSLNGSWDLMLSLSDKKPYVAKRYESGSVRRILNMKFDRPASSFLVPEVSTVKEEAPVFWGLSTSTIRGTVVWNGARAELSMELSDGRDSAAPWKRKKNEQTLQVVYGNNRFYYIMAI